MEIIHDYEVLEKIGETAGSLVYRGRRPGERDTVILKILKTRLPLPSEIARFKQEYEIIKNLNIDGVIKTFEIIGHENGFVIVLEDFNGVSIENILNSGKIFDIKSFLEASVKISEAMGEVHKRGIIHKDIKPGNILINQDGMIKITDFGISSVLTHEQEQIYIPDVIKGSLLYMSPEQTGRMNRGIDYRTDLYSLGITFYKMLTGRVPFDSKDPLEIIHSHMAKEPVPAFEYNNIPRVISNIIMKLLAKNAEDRYQTAIGLMADLKECLERLDTDGNIAEFRLAKHDISSRFIIPQKLFGREKEIGLLISAFNTVSNREISDKDDSHFKVIMVTGRPGVGKSSLINEINKSVITKKGYFLSGKFEKFRGDTPYSAIIHIFQKLLKQILTESGEKIKSLKMNIQDALGQSGKIITDIIPELELIIGKQPEVPQLGSIETRNRFNIVFARFIEVFAKKEHPIVLFLDDLQWADPASLQLIKNIISMGIKYLLIIGSYRDNELSENHPLIVTLNEIEKINIRINRIVLSDLAQKDIKDLIVNFLRCSEKKGSELAELVLKKTGGNPFFINEFMQRLYNEKMLELDPYSGWIWDIDTIREMHITDNVVEFLSEKIKKLPETVQDVLKNCACIGNRFDLETLSSLLGKSIDETLEVLTELIDEGFIGISGNLYIFNHNRIQEASYSLLLNEEKPLVHYAIGKLMLKKTDPDDLYKKIFYITDQLNLGQDLIIFNKEKEDLARLNYECGIKAKKSSAYLTSFNYFQTGICLLEEKCWEKQYDLELGLYTEAVETAYLNGNYDSMNTYSSVVIDNARDIYDKIPVYESGILTYDAQGDFKAGINACLDVLEKLNYPLPRNPGRLRMKIAFLTIRLYLLLKGTDSLLDLPVMTDHHMLVVFKIFSYLTRSALYIYPDLCFYAIIEMIKLSFKYGQCDTQSLAYIRMANVLINVIGDVDTGYKLGNIGLQLIKKFNARNYEAGAFAHYYLFIAHWKEHLKSVRAAFMKTYFIALETGDIQTSSLCLILYDAMSINLASELNQSEQQMAKDYSKMVQLNQIPFLGLFSIFWQLQLILLGKTDSHAELTGTVFNKTQMTATWEKYFSYTPLGTFYITELMMRYIFNDYKKAMNDSDAAAEYLGSVTGGLAIFDYYFYSSLVMLVLYPDQTEKKKKEYIRLVNQNIKKIKGWAIHAPMNNDHRIRIIEAEKLRIIGSNIPAGEAYDRAIELSRKNEFLIEEAIANELAGNFYMSTGRRNLARVYIQDAYACYARWGALAKLKQLQDVYPEILSQAGNALAGEDSDGSASGAAASSIIDLRTVVKASQIISGEVALKKLLAKMIKIAMENAGAQKGFMILEDNGRYVIEAEGTIEREEIKVLNSIPIESHSGLSASIVNYTARTTDILLLNNASVEGDFINDSYIEKNKPKSILCAPIISQGKLIGIIYLENNLSTGAFTQERIEILNILSSQMAISIENAKFYKNLEDKVRERTEELSITNTQLKNEVAEREKIEEKLKTSNKELESFAYIVSHDLQEPLRKIMTFGDRLKEKNSHNNEKRADYIERMQNAATRMQGLIQGLLHYSRVTTKTQPFEKIDLNRIINEVISDLEVRILDTGGNVETGNLPVVYADPLQTRQLFQNLIGNALKFRRKDESPVIKIYSTGNGAGNYQTVVVEDNGIGIDEKDYVKLFGVFQRLHGRTEFEGYGIGLAICKKIIERHGGKITVESKIDIGTKFIISMPV